MSRLADLVTAGHRLMQRLDGSRVIFEGRPVVHYGIASEKIEERKLEPGGFTGEYDYVVSLTHSNLDGFVPQNGKRVRVDNETYIIRSLRKDSVGVMLFLMSIETKKPDV